MQYYAILLLTSLFSSIPAFLFAGNSNDDNANDVIDKNGYVAFCPCMGRFGNQADQYLGTLAFAKGLDRTLILPPWIEYRRAITPYTKMVPFDEYFDVKTVAEYHRVITMEDFMETIAPTIWSTGKRTGWYIPTRGNYLPCHGGFGAVFVFPVFCYMARHGRNTDSCNAKDGNPFGPFWDNFHVDFDSSEFYGSLSFDTLGSREARDQWQSRYPASRYPVLAFTGPPASFPVTKPNAPLHKYLKWSASMADRRDEFIANKIGGLAYIGIHLRNGPDWTNACKYSEGEDANPNMFASAQCLGYSNENGKVTKELCFPSEESIVREVGKYIDKLNATCLFVATDWEPMEERFRSEFPSVKVIRQEGDDPNPHLDLAVLAHADHFIGNCVSTFSAFVKRERDVLEKTTTFFNFRSKKNKDEL